MHPTDLMTYGPLAVFALIAAIGLRSAFQKNRASYYGRKEMRR